ncbi:MAG: ribose-phosphate diphosphokinase [Nevskia sp.]|nr:ribose-phosphate diphosphokinase [Nevskia sp.]
MTSGTSPVVLALPGNEDLAADLATEMHAERGVLALHRFPDDETCVRVVTQVAGRDVVLACALDRPDEKLVALYLAASTLRALGVHRIVLVAPYLPYMRQDRSFHVGEGVSAQHIGAWLSSFVDGLVTVEPHLHRIHNLDQVYRIPTRVVSAAVGIARWIRENMLQPVVVGPDEESRPWVSAIAHDVPCPFLVLDKVRYGDRDVEVRQPDVPTHLECTPVLVDDIVSSGHTMIMAMQRLRANGYGPPVCIGVHALFSQNAYEQLRHIGVQEVVTCNTIRHISNGIDLRHSLAVQATELLDSLPPRQGVTP